MRSSCPAFARRVELLRGCIVIHLDFETRSTVNLRDRGAHVYARHPSTEVVCAAWSFGDGEPLLWFPPWTGIKCDPIDGLVDAIRRREMIAAYNAEFERLILTHVLMRQIDGLPPIRYDQFYCVAINAYAMTFGRSLDDVSKQLGIAEKKDPRGLELIRRYSVPKEFTVGGAPLYHEDRDGLIEFGEYCKQDVRTERAILAELEPLSDKELALYHVDQAINDRGFPVDLELCHAAIDVANAAQERAAERLVDLSLGTIDAATQRQRIFELAQSMGYTRKKIDSKNIEAFFRSDAAAVAPPELIELLEIRQAYGATAHKKFETAIARSCDDGRVRGSLLMNGARTLRWTGAGVQPQNMKRGLNDPEEQSQVIDAIKTRDVELIELCCGPLIETLGSAARGMVRAEPGRELIVSDYSQIEARVLAVIADDEPNLTAFREGRCIYKQMGSVISGKPYDAIDKDSDERFIGKQAELAFGYGMGEKTFQERLKADGRELPLSVCKDVKVKYRALHKAIVAFWKRIELDALKCVNTKQRVVRKWYRFDTHSRGLCLTGPSGARMWYIDPQIRIMDRFGNGDPRPVLTYMGLSGYVWTRLETYDGKLTENLVQFVSRCVQADAVVAAERAGFDVVIHTHDEIVAHNRIGEMSISQLEMIMRSASKHWAKGWPIDAAGGWKGERYRK